MWQSTGQSNTRQNTNWISSSYERGSDQPGLNVPSIVNQVFSCNAVATGCGQTSPLILKEHISWWGLPPIKALRSDARFLSHPFTNRFDFCIRKGGHELPRGDTVHNRHRFAGERVHLDKLYPAPGGVDVADVAEPLAVGRDLVVARADAANLQEQALDDDRANFRRLRYVLENARK